VSDVRYVVRALTGYGGTSRRAPLQTDVYVLDSWYSWHVVYTATTARHVPVYGGGARTYDEKLIAVRSAAARTARMLNEEHDAWLTSLDVTPPERQGSPMHAAHVGEDSQAREGKAV
jgi:hypothetical protein